MQPRPQCRAYAFECIGTAVAKWSAMPQPTFELELTNVAYPKRVYLYIYIYIWLVHTSINLNILMKNLQRIYHLFDQVRTMYFASI